MRVKVLLVIGQLQQGGAEGQLVHLARGLAGSTFEPSVACLSEVAEPHASNLRAEGIPVTIFPRRGRRDLARVRALAAHLRETKAGIVHSFLVGANAYAYAATRLAGIPRLVVSSRTTMRAPGTIAWLVHSWVFARASAVIANSEAVKEFTASHYGVPARRIHVVRNGVEIGEYAGAGGVRSSVRRDLGAADGDILVGTLGRLSREKNLDLFVRMAGEITREFPEARFAIVGEGPCRRAVDSAVRSAGLQSRILLAGGRSDIPDLLSALDLFVTTSDTEGLPNAVMEAMAAGVPVVATRVGGTHEVVSDGVTGLLVPPGRLEPLLDAVRPLIRDAAARRRFGEAGRARIASEFGVARMIEGTRAVYDAVLASAGGAVS